MQYYEIIIEIKNIIANQITNSITVNKSKVQPSPWSHKIDFTITFLNLQYKIYICKKFENEKTR